jgi:recombination protein RecA
VFSGPTKAGKTTLALQVAKNAQELYDCPVVFANVEGRFKGQSIRSVSGLNPDNVHVIESTESNILSGEDYLWAVEEAIKTMPGCVVVIDSISRLYTKASQAEDVSANKRSTTPKLLADFCDRLCSIVPVTNSIVLCIAQVYANNAAKPNQKTTVVGGGNAVKYQADILMNIDYTKPWKEKVGGDDVQVGKELYWSILSNAIGQPPEGQITNYLRFGHGIDKLKEVTTLATDLGIITQKGAWCYYGEEKFNGKQVLGDFLKDNPDVCKEIEDQIRSITINPDLVKDYEGNRPQWA